MRIKIRLDTMGEISKFVNTVNQFPEKVNLEDNDGHRVNAKSMLGVMYTLEFSEIYCTCERDISGALLPYIVVEEDHE